MVLTGARWQRPICGGPGHRRQSRGSWHQRRRRGRRRPQNGQWDQICKGEGGGGVEAKDFVSGGGSRGDEGTFRGEFDG